MYTYDNVNLTMKSIWKSGYLAMRINLQMEEREIDEFKYGNFTHSYLMPRSLFEQHFE